MDTIANYKQHAAAELSIGIGHLEAALHLWSPSKGLSPREERESAEVAAWHKFSGLIDQLRALHAGEGPGA